jgi:hypothetical protein
MDLVTDAVDGDAMAASGVAEIQSGLSTHTPANVVDEWESQSQLDPTGFHVNVLEVGGTAQTPGDIITELDNIDTALVAIADALDTLFTDPAAEPGQGAPPANAGRMVKLDYIYKQIRNLKEQTATEYKLYNDAGTVVDQKATISDDGTTASFGELVSGP